MRTLYLLAFLVVMLASLVAWSPALISRINGLATAVSGGALKSLVGSQERVAITTARSISTGVPASVSSNFGPVSSPGQEQSPTRQEGLLQAEAEDQFQQFTRYSGIMASLETSPTPNGSADPISAVPKCTAITSGIKAGSKPAYELEPELPKLSPADFRAYNRLAVMMDRYVCPSLLHF